MVEVNVKGGTINGISDGQIDRFLGIPYAQPFNATSRFKHSQLNHGISNSYIDARKVQPIPPQPYNALEDFFQLNKMVLTVLYKMKIVCISIYGEKVVAVR